MKIAYVTPTYPPYPGGIGIAAAYTAREMNMRGHEVEVFTPEYEGMKNEEFPSRMLGTGKIKNDGQVTVHFVKPFLKYGNAAFLPQLVKLLKDFDVVHCYYPFFGGLEVAAHAKRRGARFALVVHHEMDTVGEGILRRIFKAHEQRIMPWVLRQTDTFAVLSQDYLDHSPFASMLKKPTMPPVAIIPNGVDVDLFKPCARRESAHEPVRLILVAGLDRAHYFKGVYVLIDAVSMLQDMGIACTATIVGEGDMRAEYEVYARNKSVGDRIHFTGLVTHEKLLALLHEHDIFVMPSVASTESFCIAAAEAQACALPAIVSDLPGLRETIGVGETGLVFPVGSVAGLADCITRFVMDTDLWRTCSHAARARMVERFAWPKVADAAVRAYDQAILHRRGI